jgi:peptidyl-prolyl cis-trans isomerase B (cyclophilin B)
MRMVQDAILTGMFLALVGPLACSRVQQAELGIVTEKKQSQPPAGPTSLSPRAIITTKYGDMEMVFLPEVAPKTVENFIKLAKSGFYDGTTFHRLVPGFMIQGGDPLTKDSRRKDEYGSGGPGYKLKAEFNDTPHRRGIVSMARAANDPDSAGSQFFIMVEYAPHLDGTYTAFGKIVRGLGIADKIVNIPRTQDGRDLALERVEMKVKIIE